MRRSKSEICLAVLKVLADSERPIGVTKLTLKAKVSYSVLKPLLSFMIEKSYVEQVILKDGAISFSITLTGQSILEQNEQFIQSRSAKDNEMILAVAISKL